MGSNPTLSANLTLNHPEKRCIGATADVAARVTLLRVAILSKGAEGAAVEPSLVCELRPGKPFGWRATSKHAAASFVLGEFVHAPLGRSSPVTAAVSGLNNEVARNGQLLSSVENALTFIRRLPVADGLTIRSGDDVFFRFSHSTYRKKVLR